MLPLSYFSGHKDAVGNCYFQSVLHVRKYPEHKNLVLKCIYHFLNFPFLCPRECSFGFTVLGFVLAVYEYQVISPFSLWFHNPGHNSFSQCSWRKHLSSATTSLKLWYSLPKLLMFFVFAAFSFYPPHSNSFSYPVSSPPPPYDHISYSVHCHSIVPGSWRRRRSLWLY